MENLQQTMEAFQSEYDHGRHKGRVEALAVMMKMTFVIFCGYVLFKAYIVLGV